MKVFVRSYETNYSVLVCHALALPFDVLAGGANRSLAGCVEVARDPIMPGEALSPSSGPGGGRSDPITEAPFAIDLLEQHGSQSNTFQARLL